MVVFNFTGLQEYNLLNGIADHLTTIDETIRLGQFLDVKKSRILHSLNEERNVKRAAQNVLQMFWEDMVSTREEKLERIRTALMCIDNKSDLICLNKLIVTPPKAKHGTDSQLIPPSVSH